MSDDAITPDVMDVELTPVKVPQVPHSVTPIAETPGPGFVKDVRGLVPRSADLDPIFVQFVDGLCAPRELKSALASLGTDRAFKFLGALLDLEKKRGSGSKTIVAAAKKCGIGMDTLAEMWRSHSTALAMMKLVSNAPKLAQDLIEAAANKPDVCPSCLGEGILELRLTTAGTRECPRCQGSGEIVRPGDRDARRDALEWAGYTGQPGKSATPAGNTSVYLNLVLPRKES